MKIRNASSGAAVVQSRVLAIDPGYDRLGIAVVEGNASRPLVLWSDCLIPPKGAASARLAAISAALERAVVAYAPNCVALEKIFFSTNVKTAIGVAEARGAVLAAAGLAGLPVREFSPQQVKLAVAGNGAADKRAIARMVPRLVALSPRRRLDDEFDAIALGIAALATGCMVR